MSSILDPALKHLTDIRPFLDPEIIPKELRPLIQGYSEDILEFEATLFKLYLCGQPLVQNCYRSEKHHRFRKRYIQQILACTISPVVAWRREALQSLHEKYPGYWTDAEALECCITHPNPASDCVRPCDRAKCYYNDANGCTCGRPLLYHGPS